MSQTQVYKNAYAGNQRLRRLLRFDIRHRCRRLHEVLAELNIQVAGQDVLDIGFGGGDLLASFPPSCRVRGVEISESAVRSAKGDRRFTSFEMADFALIPEGNVRSISTGPFDLVLSSHTLEHVPDDRAVVEVMFDRLRPGGVSCVFVPVEESGYNPDHVRVYTVDGLAALLGEVGFEILFKEGSMHLNGHVWKCLTVPSRRRWPVLGPMANGLRLWSMFAIPYPVVRAMERRMGQLGFGPRQAFVVGRRPG